MFYIPKLDTHPQTIFKARDTFSTNLEQGNFVSKSLKMEIQTESSPFPVLSSCSRTSALKRAVHTSGNLRNNQSRVASQLTTNNV